ncbi:esterase, partial [Pseudomonas sp. RTC3]|nr:esterase [Pseudomonas sp. RTC3]
MSVWLKTPDIYQLNALQKNTIGEVLDNRFEAFDKSSLTASMVID